MHKVIHARTPRSNAFTLLELLIVLVVMVLLTTVAAPSFSRLFKTSKVDQAAQIVMGALWRAASEAQRFGYPVGVYYGQQPGIGPTAVLMRADGAGGWTPVGLPPPGKLEIWTVKPRDNRMFGDRCPYPLPGGHTCDGGDNRSVPWNYQVNPLTPAGGITLPEGVRVMTGVYTSGTTPTFTHANLSRTPQGEAKLHVTVYSQNGGSPGYSNGSWHACNYLCIYEDTGQHVILHTGEYLKPRVRPKILGYNVLKRVGSTTFTELSKLPKLLDNYPSN